MDHKINQPNTDRPCPDFMIVGTGRCGSTLLQAMLVSHELISIPYETKFFFQLDPVALGFEDPLPKNSVQSYIQAIQARNVSGLLKYNPETLSLYCQAVHDGMHDARSQLKWILSENNGHEAAFPNRLMGEKTPGHWMKLNRILTINPTCKIIHIVRDPRDVTESLMRMSWWVTPSTYLTARHCKKTLLACLAQEKQLGSNQHLWVRFEDLLDDPQTVLCRVCSYLNIEFDERMSHRPESSKKNLNPNNDEWMKGSMKPLDPSRLGTYREKLTRGQVRLIESIVGPGLMKSFGYPTDSTAIDRVLAVGQRVIHAGGGFISKQTSSVRRRLGLSR